VIAVGTPEMVAEVKASYTGHYLKPYLAKLTDKKARA
jgi:excinuclease UvrABC ATPase subunit